ncbi:hypothetical protein Tco_0458242 [Tanacetum coccineum]
MSSNAEQTQSEGFSNSLDTGKLHTSNEVTQPRTELYLDELTDGSSGTIIVMICHSWDVHTITRHYLSTDFVMSDAKANKEVVLAYSTTMLYDELMVCDVCEKDVWTAAKAPLAVIGIFKSTGMSVQQSYDAKHHRCCGLRSSYVMNTPL